VDLNQLPKGEFPTLGNGARALLLDVLEITVKIGPEFWSYAIRQGLQIETDATCDLINNNEELARIEAVTKALKILGRDDDPAAVSSGLTWVPL
jgi:hypothetical protein